MSDPPTSKYFAFAIAVVISPAAFIGAATALPFFAHEAATPEDAFIVNVVYAVGIPIYLFLLVWFWRKPREWTLAGLRGSVWTFLLLLGYLSGIAVVWFGFSI